MVTRREFLKFSMVGLASFLLRPKPPKKRKKKMQINLDTTGGLVLQTIISYNWPHTIDAGLLYPGLVVGVATSVTDEEASSVTYAGISLTRARKDTNGAGYGSEIWYLSNPPVGAGSVAVTLTATMDSVVGSASYSFFGGIGAIGGTFGTGGGTASHSITTLHSNSMVFGLINAINQAPVQGTSQSNLWEVVSAATVNCLGTDKGPIATPASTALSWTGLASAQWVIAMAELLSYQANPSALMGM